MRILCLNVPKESVTFEDYVPHLLGETLCAWQLYKPEVIRDIYFRKDRPGVVVMIEADSVEATNDFPLKKAGLLDFELIPFGSYTF